MESNVKLAEEFAKIYKNEWQSARKSLLSNQKHDEEIIYLLMRIARSGYNYCMDAVTGKQPSSQSSRKLTEEFIRHKQPSFLNGDHVTNEVHAYIQKLIDVLLLMCLPDNQSTIFWIPKGDPVDPEMFVIEGTGGICDWTVWPAVLGPSGKMLHKGIILPIS